MTITIDLAPEEEKNLQWQAELAGKDISAYVQETMRNMIVPKPPPLSNEEWEKLADEAAGIVDSSALPLSDYAVSREALYEERH